MTIKPLGDRILALPNKKESKTSSGLFIPETASQKINEGKVLAVGTDSEAIKVSVNDEIIFDQYAGVKIEIDGKDHLILKMEDILAKIEAT